MSLPVRAYPAARQHRGRLNLEPQLDAGTATSSAPTT